MKILDDTMDAPHLLKSLGALLLAFVLSITLENIQNGSEYTVIIGRYLTGFAMIIAAIIVIIKAFKSLKKPNDE